MQTFKQLNTQIHLQIRVNYKITVTYTKAFFYQQRLING